MTYNDTATIPELSSTLTKSAGFRYAGPVTTVAYFCLAKIISIIRLEKPRFSRQDKQRRYTLFALLALTGCVHCIELVTYLRHCTYGNGGWPQEEKVINHLAYILIHTCLILGLWETTRPLWHHFEGALSVATIEQLHALRWMPQSVLSGQQASLQGQDSIFHRVRLSLLAPLVIASLSFRYAGRHGSEPFPSPQDEASASGEEISFSDDDDDDDDESQKQKDKFKARHRQRLQDAGDWWTFLKQYRVILPLFWPANDRKTQFYIVVLILQLLAVRVLGVLTPRQMGITTDGLVAATRTHDVPWVSILNWAALSVIGSTGVLGAIKDWSHIRVTQFSFMQISSTSYRHIMGLSMDFHKSKSSSEVFQAMYHGHMLQETFDIICFRLWPKTADLLIGMLVIAHTYDDYITFIMISTGVIYLWLSISMAPRSARYRRQYSRMWREFNRTQCDGLLEWQTVSQFNQQKYESERFEQKLKELQSSQLRYYNSDTLKRVAQGLIMTSSRTVATVLVMYRIAQGTMPIGSIVSFIAYWSKIMDPLDFFALVSDELGAILIDSERLLDLLQLKATVADAPDATEIKVDVGKVEFEHVNFSYDPRRATITDTSFVTTAGTTTALVGETGSGKTTLLTLLFRYFDVASGAIRIDGQDIRSVTLDSLRNLFGVVSQDAALFNVTLMENIRYARLDATDDEVMEVCRAAAIHDKIMQFPDQYKTKVGERGIKLSGGELQRVAIARALLRDPKIVLLDEATSQIDVSTEANIQQALRKLTAGRTTFVIAHRLSTIQHADQILVVGDGKILERGTHHELLRNGGKYAFLWQTQLKMEQTVEENASGGGRAAS